jgi:hypothetical protein
MSTFECTFEQLKKAGKDLLEAIPTATNDQIANGVKAFNLMYLGMKPQDGPFGASELHQAPILHNIIMKEVFKLRPDYIMGDVLGE